MIFKAFFNAVAVVSVASMAAAGQTSAKAPVKAASATAATASKPYAPPKTPWGDPDVHGNYTNKYEQGTPFERPAELEGKTLADIQAKELAEIIQKRQQRAIENAPFLSGDPTGTIAGPMEFRDIYEVAKASRPWFVTDPPDGKIPPLLKLLPVGRRAAMRCRASGTIGGILPSGGSVTNQGRLALATS